MSEKEILGLIGLTEGSVPRYRGCEILENQIVICTRTGGNNRKYYSNETLTRNPYYLYDEDDDFDNTYAYFYFEIPNGDVGR